MRQHAVGEGRFNRAAKDIRSGNSRHSFTFVAAGKLNGKAPRRKIGTGDHGGECVEDHMLGLFDNLIGKFASGRLAHVSGESRSDVARRSGGALPAGGQGPDAGAYKSGSRKFE